MSEGVARKLDFSKKTIAQCGWSAGGGCTIHLRRAARNTEPS
jgi:hypothetical protein